MTRKNGNKSNFHYVVEFFDKENNFNFIERKYYLTSEDLIKEFGCCRKALFNHINEPRKKSKKLGHVKITRICEPVFILRENPDLY